eukprot:m.75592 g.75592  ORF g.75592 m.75592 type:complete len:130 (-) comp12453_c0_seq2:1356-1745(-)
MVFFFLLFFYLSCVFAREFASTQYINRQPTTRVVPLSRDMMHVSSGRKTHQELNWKLCSVPRCTKHKAEEDAGDLSCFPLISFALQCRSPLPHTHSIHTDASVSLFVAPPSCPLLESSDVRLGFFVENG